MLRRAGLVVALSLVGGSAFASTASAQLACPDTSVVTTPGTALTFTAPVCTNAMGPVNYSETTPPASGVATYGAQFSYTPNMGFHGRDSFVYNGFDGGIAPDDGTISVLVDTKPTCTSGTATVAANNSVQVPVTCSDADGDTFTYELDNPANGTVAKQGNAYVYTPKTGFSGADSFTFRGKDVFDLASDSATISVTVTAAPGPTATPTPTPTPTATPDKTAPTVTLKNASKKQALSVTVTANEAGSATLTAALDNATAKKLKLSRTVGTAKQTLTADKPATLKIKFSSKAAKAFKKRKSVKLTVTAVVTDAAGNKTTKTLKVTLRR